MVKPILYDEIKKYGACCSNCICKNECESHNEIQKKHYDYDWICGNWKLDKNAKVQLSLFDFKDE